MKIAIIGAGSVGSTLGSAWAARGHQVRFGVNDPTDGRVEAVLRSAPGARADNVRAAAQFGEVVVLAVPFDAIEEVLRRAGDLAGKIVIDCTNPLTPDFRDLSIGFTSSGGERVAALAEGASVFKTLNQTGFATMAEPVFDGHRSVMFVAGDDGEHKTTVIELIAELGFETVDAGPLKAARLLEPLAMLWIHLAHSQGLGRDFAFALLRR
jgi:8-hydroxy-5-deazaflavin:NADPH oxidoreductase